MLPLAPVCFPLTCPPVAPRGVGATCADADEAASLHRLEHELEVQVRTTRSRVTRFPVPFFPNPRTYVTLVPRRCLPSRQRSLIRKALADVTPMGQTTTRGVVGNGMVTDEVDHAMDDVDSEPDDDKPDDDNGREFKTVASPLERLFDGRSKKE